MLLCSLFSILEQPGDGFGFAVLPWLDVTAEVCPDSKELKEALLRLETASTTLATATAAASLEARIRAVVAGSAVPPKNPAHVFPQFVASALIILKVSDVLPHQSLETGIGSNELFM